MEEKKALRKQFADIIKSHGKIIAGEALLQLFVLGFLFVVDGLRTISGVLFTVIYGTLIYCCAKKTGEADMKSYSVLKPSLIKGALLGASIVIISLLLFAVDKGMWAWFCADGELTNMFAKIVNVFFVIWIIPYYGFMGDGTGIVTAAVAILMIAVPVLSSLLGYFAGIKGINILEKFNLSMYEKK